jgi:hypothetical protein
MAATAAAATTAAAAALAALAAQQCILQEVRLLACCTASSQLATQVLLAAQLAWQGRLAVVASKPGCSSYQQQQLVHARIGAVAAAA